MTGQICLEETEEEEVFPGIAKRAENFQETAARAGDYNGQPISRLDLIRAAASGMPELPDAEFRLLIYYLCKLDTRKLGESKTSVWPGSVTTCDETGKGQSTIRRLKGRLEKSGLVIRKYDQRNRPLDGDAVDLAPYLAQVPSIMRKIEEKASIRQARWDTSRTPDEKTADAIVSADALRNERLNSTPKPLDSCLELEDSEKSDAENSSTNSQDFLATKRAVEDAKTINKALDLSPKLKTALDPDDQGVSAKQAADRIWSALPKLIDNDGSNSINHTFLWCAKRHGAKAFIFLAVALEDPTAKDPRKLFGWFATHPQKIDLTRNLERIKHKPKPFALNDDKPRLPGGTFENGIALAIVDQIGVPAYNSWLDPQSIRFTVKSDRLVIEHGSPIAQKYLRERYGAQLSRAAETLGYDGFMIKDLE